MSTFGAADLEKATEMSTIYKSNFRDWLVSKGPAAFDEHKHGEWMIFSCPIAVWLTETTGQRAMVSPDYYMMYGERFPMPEWGRYFIMRFDSDPTTWVGNVWDAPSALRVLNEG